MNLKDKIILVTGGSHGIGLDTAIKLKSKGAVVLINARDKSRAGALVKQKTPRSVWHVPSGRADTQT